MNQIILIFICCFLFGQSYGQYTAKVTDGKSYADLDVRISDDVYMEDLGVEIGYDIFMEDFTIGFTNSKSQATVIITDTYSADFEVNMTSSSYADLDIEASDDVYMEDIGIEIKKSGYVDYLVYSEIDLMSIEVLVCALLPIINSHLDNNNRLEDVPVLKN